MRKRQLKRRLEEAEVLIASGIIAMRLTQEYVGAEMLPERRGWSWWDWTEKACDFLVGAHPR